MESRCRLSRTSLRRAGVALLVAIPLVAASPHALAEPKPKPAAQPASDPAFTQALRQGDRAYLDRRYPEAEAEYEKAVEKQPHNPVGYARLATAQRQQSKFDQALATLSEGLQTSTTLTERAKLIFLQADIHERMHALGEAEARWNAYLELVGATGERTIDLDAPQAKPQPTVEGETVYTATADERLRQVVAADKRYKEYAPVRERIKKREKEADAKSRQR